MSIQTKYTTSLELDKVLAKLANETTCEAARLRALHLTPVTTEEEAVRLMAYTADANRLTNRYGTPTAQNVRDCTGSLERARLGAQLPIPELLSILHLLETIRRMIGWKKQSEEEVTALDYLFSCLTSFKSLEDELKGAILDEETLSDSASPALADIRRKIRNNQQKVRSQLDNMIRSSSYQKYLQDAIVTMRDGRYVVPVKAEYRSEVKGLVHDTSSSGATVFIEPMSVVEANNEIKVLESQEKKEIDRILYELSASVGSYAEAISRSYEVLVELDLYFAKSRLADKMKASVPQITGDRKIKLIRARHPLIDPEKIVPVDVTLGVEFDTLVITGPNTGGKTVLLKTVGLLTLMMMCGLMIPAADGSSLSVFDEVLSDIGDEQSIEQSLSTFSAHMTNIVKILNQADSHSLCLFDELCAGTDPTEGAALAISILSFLHNMKCRTMATTHYSELKVFALSTPGVENACCEFNVETLRPTYKLLIGIPGKSNAFAISKQLGLPDYIIDDAKTHLESNDEAFEDLLANLEQSRVTIEKEREEIASYKEEISRLKKNIEQKEERLDERKEKLLKNANEEAQRILREAKETADQTIRNINKLAASSGVGKELEAERTKLREKLDKVDKNLSLKNNKGPKKTISPKKLKIGDGVKVLTMNLKGTVSTLPNAKGDLYVQMGILRSLVNIKDLELLDEASVSGPGLDPAAMKRNNTGSGKIKMAKSFSVSPEVNLIGMTTDEAMPVLDKYLDDAYLAHLPQVRVVHGRGTGALRAAVHKHLKKLKYVKEFRLGEFGEGDTGVTIVTFK